MINDYEEAAQPSLNRSTGFVARFPCVVFKCLFTNAGFMLCTKSFEIMYLLYIQSALYGLLPLPNLCRLMCLDVLPLAIYFYGLYTCPFS